MSKVVKYGGGFLGCFLLFAVCVPKKNLFEEKTGSVDTGLPTSTPSVLLSPAADCDPVFLTAVAIKAEMEKNEARLVHAWKKAGCATVVGKVISVSAGIGDQPFVSVGTGRKYELNSIVQCSPKVPEAAFALSKGQQLFFTGKTGDEVMGTLMLEDCEWES